MIHHMISKAFVAMSLACVFTGISSVDAFAHSIRWGVCSHDNSKTTNMDPIFQELQQRGIKQYRVDANLADDTDPYEVQMFQNMASLARKHGITLKPILFTPFAWGDRTDGGKYPTGDQAALYLQGYNRTYAFVNALKYDIRDWEMGNEINLLVHDASGSLLFGKGWTASEFDQPAMNDWAAVLRGMSDAISHINAESGLQLRRTLNTTSTMFGFLDFMASKNVIFEVISYHYYERLGTDPHNYWGGVRPNFDLFKQLASYNKSVTFNEVNSGEIYDSNYENEAGQPDTEKGFESLNATLTYLRDQTDARIESVLIYELKDEPSKQPPENRFGLTYDINTPKVSLYLLTFFAGGNLTPSEVQELSSRGFIPGCSRNHRAESGERDGSSNPKE